ncbi:MAG: DUF4175 family protein [Magnetospirillum sp.]|nr:DUF4175 family protein [Magnetospirillum sp.]
MVSPHPANTPEDPIGDRLARRLRLARWVLAWERAWPALAAPLGVAGLFLALALFDVLPRLAVWLHGLILVGFAAAVALLVWRGFRRFGWPGDEEAARRLERDSGLAHRPLAALADTLATDADDPRARALWSAHRRRMAALVARLRLAPPSPGMAARDPLGLRAGVILLLVVAAAAGWRDAPERLLRAVSPPVGSLVPAAALDLWVTPPSYTGLPPTLLRPGARGTVVIPSGSAVAAALTGGWGDARLDVDGAATRFERLPDGGQRVEAVLDSGTRMAVRQGFRTLASWPIRVVRDALPSIEFTAIPSAGDRGRLRIAVAASDDYGLARAWVEIRRVGAPPGEAPLTVDLPLPGGKPRSVQASSWHDLTGHPWAGLPVVVRPMARDTAGQTAGGEPATVTLPERDFADPAARAIVEHRRLVTENRDNAPDAVAVLDAISGRPDLFHEDVAALLEVRLARDVLAREGFDLGEAQELMWNAALRIEDGAAASAERVLGEARNALEKALDQGATAAELQRLVQQYQDAVRRLLEALARNVQTGAPGMAPDATVIGEDELKQMLDRMRGLAETGSRDALRRMLGDLTQMMAGLRTAPAAPGGEAGKAAAGLRDLARRQQELLDRSFREAQRPPAAGAAPGGEPAGADAGQAARAQAELGRRLAELTRTLGRALGNAVPDTLADAGEWMGQAARDLASGRWAEAARSQSQALQNLRDGVSEAIEKLNAMGGAGSLRQDPFGRPLPGAIGEDSTTRIPDRPDVQRAHDILEELRRRANDPARPKPELDYLDRLLKQF